MTKTKGADLRGGSSKEKHLTNRTKRFLRSEYKQFSHSNQCNYCGSDYMRFSLMGYCQRCQQRAEYVLRERLMTAAKVKTRGASAEEVQA